MRAVLARENEPAGSDGGSPAGDDRALVARLSSGDPAAFASIVHAHLPSLLAIGRRMLRDDAEAEDVAQEALIRLWRNADRLEIGEGGVKPWLRRVVSNLCIDRVRSARHLSVVEEVPEQPEPASQMRSLGEKQLSARVDAALKQLPERQRLALVLFHYEGMSQVEVGQVLGVSDEAVESLLSRARRALKGLLKSEWQELLPDEGIV